MCLTSILILCCQEKLGDGIGISEQCNVCIVIMHQLIADHACRVKRNIGLCRFVQSKLHSGNLTLAVISRYGFQRGLSLDSILISGVSSRETVQHPFRVSLSTAFANERRRYKCNVFFHWLTTRRIWFKTETENGPVSGWGLVCTEHYYAIVVEPFITNTIGFAYQLTDRSDTV